MSKTFFSRKCSKISVFDAISKILNNNGGKSKLMIHTANGIYFGNLREVPQLDNIEVQDDDDILTCFNKIYTSHLDKYENSEDYNDDNEIIENPITIQLEDVELVTSGKTCLLYTSDAADE